MKALKPVFLASTWTSKAAILGAPIIIVALFFSLSDAREISIESLESKTMLDGPVYNKIAWFSFKDKDVWMMNQSHHGPQAGAQQWERLAIAIDKTKSPKTARFMQLEPGPLEWSEGIKERPFRVSCFMCHTNGPRAIRPNIDSTTTPMTIKDRFKVAAWNLRIKTYGRVQYDPVHDSNDKTLLTPFRQRGSLENNALTVKACTRCHNEDGLISRGVLQRQNAMTIQFMVSSGFMPPLGFSLSGKERKQIDDFISGF